MKKSFRWHLFIRIFMATALIFVANRLIAQYLTGQHMNARIEQTIAGTLDHCSGEAASLPEFLSCAARINRGDAIANVSEFYVLCPPLKTGTPTAQEPACLHARLADESARDGARIIGASVKVRQQSIAGEDWLEFSLPAMPEGPRVMVKQADIAAYIGSIYGLRNRIITYVLPVIVLMLGLLTVYMTWAAMRPIRQLEQSLTRLSSHNLDKPLDLPPPYREFERFVTVFEQLRERLSQSFLQARRFAADASHELRTPLTILRGNSERLIAELPTGSEAQVRMRLIGDEIERLIEITEKLLLLSRADANSLRYDMEPILLSVLVEELAMDAAGFNPELKIDSEIEQGIWWICDHSLVQQLVYNLYTNAAKYNVAGGWIRISLAKRRDRFVLSIENPCDTIPADLSERAFQRFYRGDAARGREVDGVGLGLSLCLEIARLHQATLGLATSDRKTVLATLEGKLPVTSP